MKTYNGMVFNVASDDLVVASDWKRDERSSDDTQQELDLSVAAAKDGGHVGRMLRAVGRPHPGLHILPRNDGALVRGSEHLLRDRDLEDGFERIFPVEIRTKLPH